MKSQKKSWIQTGTAKGLKELGNKDDRLIIESELLKAGIESNPGPSSEMTSKMPRYQKWSRKLSQWLLPYVKRCETTLTTRVQLLLSFLDPTADSTSCIFPMVCRIINLLAAELKRDFFSNQAAVTQATIEAALDDHR